MATEGNGFDALALFGEWFRMMGRAGTSVTEALSPPPPPPKPQPQGLFEWWNELFQGNDAFKGWGLPAIPPIFSGAVSGDSPQVPQVGMLRLYQERFLKFIERTKSLVGSYTDFTKIMQASLDNASRGLQARIADLAMQGKPPSGMQELYDIWLEILEKQYMEAMRSAEFLTALKEVMDQTQAFKKARDEFFTDLLRGLPIPTNTEMDALYKELYNLKREVRELKAAASARNGA
jgi:hypothetical protein